MKTSILFVCTGNAGRSQIAQVLFSAMAGNDVHVAGAGVDPWPHIHPVAERLLQERGVDTAELHPRHVGTFDNAQLDWVVTIGDRAGNETSRIGGNPTRIHWDIADPADADGTGRERDAFLRALVLIEERLPGLLEAVKKTCSASRLHLAPGLSTCIVRPNTFDPATHLPKIAAAGFTCIELNCYLGSEDFAWDRPDRVRELARVAGDCGVDVYSVHAESEFGVHPGDPSDQQVVDLCKAYADLAAELGAPVVVCHAEMGQSQDALEELAQHVAEMPCRYALENWPTWLSPAEPLRMIAELDPRAFGFVLDNGHSNISGTTGACLELCRGLLCDLHLNDNDGNEDAHALPGAGSCEWDGFMKKLEGTGYVGPLMLEVEARDRQDDLPAALRDAYDAIEMIKQA